MAFRNRLPHTTSLMPVKAVKKMQCACSGIRTQPSLESIVPTEKFNPRAVRQATFQRASLARAELRASALVPYIFGKGSENVDQMNGHADRVTLEQLTLRRRLIEVADQLL